MKRTHLVFCTDSLSLPRPWKKNAPLEFPELFLGYDKTYPFLLKERLETTEHRVDISSLAKRGGTSKDAALSVEDAFFWRSPSVVVLHIGIVDCWPRGENGALIDIDSFKQNLLLFLQNKQKFAKNIPLIVVGIMPTLSRVVAKNPGINETISDYNRVLKAVFGHNALFIDSEALFEQYGEKLLHPDGHHLSKDGHEIIAQKIQEVLMGVFAEQEMEARNPEFSMLKQKFLDSYRLKFVDRNTDTLLIVLSPHKNFVLTEHDFKYSCLYIADTKISYYCHHPQRQVEFIREFVANKGYKKVVFLGSSKAGAGSLLWSALLKGLDDDLDVYCLAFSPQTLLYPENDNIKQLPTYLNLLKRRELSRAHQVNLEHFGNIVDLVNKYKPKTYLVYSSHYDMDRVEAQRFSESPWVKLIPIPFNFHGSLLAYVVDKNNDEQLQSLADKMALDVAQDIDLKTTLPAVQKNFIDQFKDLDVPNFNEFIDEFLEEDLKV